MSKQKCSVSSPSYGPASDRKSVFSNQFKLEKLTDPTSSLIPVIFTPNSPSNS